MRERERRGNKRGKGDDRTEEKGRSMEQEEGIKYIRKGGENIRQSVHSLCRNGADAQYMQYLSKSRIPLKCPAFLFDCLYGQQDSYSFPKAS